MREITLENLGILLGLKHRTRHERASGGRINPTSHWERPFAALKLSESRSKAEHSRIWNGTDNKPVRFLPDKVTDVMCESQCDSLIMVATLLLLFETKSVREEKIV